MGLASGTKLGPYEIVSPLGAGGMGEVYRARDTRLDRDVAIKVLPANLSSDPVLRQRLEREAKAISKLSHPHICTLHDIGRQDGVDFLVMEYLEGETLERRLISCRQPYEQCRDLRSIRRSTRWKKLRYHHDSATGIEAHHPGNQLDGGSETTMTT
jgi:eukaryotic-like serine/threonine-protein kinase